MVNEKEKQNREELFRLMRENPDLPVVPMVDYEVVWDGCGRWLGAWGEAKVDEYLLTDERVFFKSCDDVFGVLEDALSYEEFEALPDDEGKCRPAYDSLPWIKAIIVNIDTPD